VFERDLDKVTRIDVPVAAEMLTSARYFTALIDELPPEGLPKVPGMNKDGGVDETTPTQVQTVPHWVRLGIWELNTGKPLARLRVRADAQFVPVGVMANASEKSLRAQQRQVNNCAIAQELRERVQARHAPAAEAAPTNIDSGEPEGPVDVGTAGTGTR